MAIKTCGTGKTYSTIALLEAGMSSGDTGELYDTVADGVPSVYYNQQITCGNTTRTYTSIDDVLIFKSGTTTCAVSAVAAGNTVTLNYLRLHSTTTQGANIAASGGTVVAIGCIAKSDAADGMLIANAGGNSSIYNVFACVGYSEGLNGIRIILGTVTSATVLIYNCTGVADGTGNGITSSSAAYGAGTTCLIKNGWFYSVGTTDVVNTGTQATLTNCYSPDGTAGNTCTVANAKFKDLDGLHSRFGLPDVAIMAGSSLIGAGADPGVTISDVFGTSKATGSGTFDVGACFYSVTAAATKPTSVQALNWSGDIWTVKWAAMADKQHAVVAGTVGGVKKYAYPAARTAPGNDRAKIAFHTNPAYAMFLHLPSQGLTADLTNATAWDVYAANVCENLSTNTTATIVTLGASPATPVFNGLTYFAAENTGFKFGWNNPSTNYTGIRLYLKASNTNSLVTATNLVVTVEPNITNYTLVKDATANWITNLSWYAAATAVNVTTTSVDTNAVHKGPVTGPGGNVILQSSSSGGTDVSGIVGKLSNITTKLNSILLAQQSNGVVVKNAIQSNSLTLKTTTQSNSLTIRTYLQSLEYATESCGILVKNAIQSNTKISKTNGVMIKNKIGALA